MKVVVSAKDKNTGIYLYSRVIDVHNSPNFKNIAINKVAISERKRVTEHVSNLYSIPKEILIELEESGYFNALHDITFVVE